MTTNLNRIVLCLMLVALQLSTAQDDVKQDDVKAKSTKDRLDFVATPMISSDPSFGNAIGGIGMILFDMDEENLSLPASTIAFGGMYSDTDSYAYGGGATLFPSPEWRISFGAGSGYVENELDVNGFPDTADFSSTIYVFGGKLERLVAEDTFMGVKLVGKRSKFDPINSWGEQYMRLLEVENTTSVSIGPTFTYDTRDNRFYPYSGILADASLMFSSPALGADNDYYVLQAALNGYHQRKPGHILAGRLFGRFTPSHTPYSDLSKLGMRSDLRGYVVGEHIANNMVTIQGEYRWNLSSSFVLVGFAGEAVLYDRGDLSTDSLFASGGVGVRYCLHKERRVHLRVDYAWGEGDQGGFYISISEAF
jgi:outer membrane protein assembly factor BamA